jgi:ribosomal protein S18 acetylase RimI-like enzyme
MLTGFQFELAGAEAVPRLRPLWLALHRHHRAVATYGPLVADDDLSWQRRQDGYLAALEGERAVLAIATTATGPVGYAFVVLHPGPDDTFDQPDTGYAELYSLSVAPDSRGHGIGGQLLELIDTELADRGITDLEVAVMAGNHEALRFYQRSGFLPSEHLLRRRTPPKDGDAEGGRGDGS